MVGTKSFQPENPDENVFFREATRHICSSLDLTVAMNRTLEFLGKYMPADGLYLGIYYPELNLAQNLVTLGPESWPMHRETIHLPVEVWEEMRAEWTSSPDFSVINDIRQEEPAFQETLKLFLPEDVSLAGTNIFLESRHLARFFLIAQGKGRYLEDHARLMNLLNDPISIALSNYLQYREVLRLKDLLADENRYLHQELQHMAGNTIIGADFGLKGVMEMVRQVAPLDSPVLLLGETGVGKEVIANALHRASKRRDGPFIKVNCGGLPGSLIDSELFGHEKGAFTGAARMKRGRFERASHGTIFLDEIGELPLEAQVKLLRVLQSGEIERVGGTETIPVDVRVISATHRNLEQMIHDGQFREDLWFRLNVFPIMIPPLRQRPQDIPALLSHFISKKCLEMKIHRPLRPAPGTVEQLMAHPWPGNVRELENMVERAIIQSLGNDSDQLTFFSQDSFIRQRAAVHGEDSSGPPHIRPLDEVIAGHILRALNMANGKIEGNGGAASMLGLHPSTLRGKMRKLGISYKKRPGK